MENCVRCNINGEEVRLFDAVYEGRMAKICERCSIIENVPIIKKPDASQLKASESGYMVYDRMKMMSGIREDTKGPTFFREDKLKELDKKPELELPEKEQLNLVQHFHWKIMQNRRRKGLSQKQLSESLSESKAAIEMIEKAKLPENAEVLIRKLEQFFQIKLRKPTHEELMEIERRETEPILLDEYGKELEIIPEPEIKQIEIEEEVETEPEISEIEYKIVGAEPVELAEEFQKKTEKQEDFEEPKGIEDFDLEKGLDIHKTNIEKVTIADLRKLHKKKIEVTRQEKIEEQGKIEERQRLIEARKEELRLMREKESNELDNILGGTELLNKEPKKESIEESDVVKEFDEELI